jgi:hypothetical protein
MTPLKKLLAMDLSDRINAVAKDVLSRKDEFQQIDNHCLAEALGVPESKRPGNDWEHISYSCKISVEEYAELNSPSSEIVYMIEDFVTPSRFKKLLKLSAGLDDISNPVFDFLKHNERYHLEEAIASMRLEDNLMNGMSCIARYTVKSDLGEDLPFEAEIEDNGTCIFLKTPYDSRDGQFVDLSNCLTETW